ncbi:DUF3861 family protein [Vibrio sp. YMD68]|uniref:DUF3861 family protein n=1 Tax=Vibrio sp. YMD68 TaxID=3042300 RepID=UPI00249C54AF|nr:DUF3861 family protein [Vibrio sp. YMD68]WGV98977.1 DUF3861 family protein [Vibrio sp. YMD68]
MTIEEVNTKSDRDLQNMKFEVEDREDLFAIVEKMKQNSGLDAPAAIRLGVSVRLLGPLMMLNRKHPLFVDFMPHFKTFMNTVKKAVKTQ